MADKNTAKLIATWIRSNGKTEEHYRLIGVGKYTAGYTDEYVLERLERDTLGADRWVVSARWGRDNNEALSILADAIGTLRTRLDALQIEIDSPPVPLRGALLP